MALSTTPHPLFVADWEGGDIGWRVWNGVDEQHINRVDFLNGIVWENGPCRLIIEAAHLQERRAISVSQVYDIDELRNLYNSANESGVQLQAFPQRLTRRARVEGIHPEQGMRFQLLDRPKQYDCMAIRQFVLSRPDVSLKNWRPIMEEDTRAQIFLAANEIRHDMTVRLNQHRPDYDLDHPDIAHAIELLRAFGEELDDDVRNQFKISFYGRNGRRGDNVWQAGDLKINPLKLAQIMSIYVTVFDENQQLRMHGENFIGMRFIWEHLLLMSPFHGRSGTARANLMYWGLRSYDHAHTEQQYQYMDDQETHDHRREVWGVWRKGVKTLMRQFRNSAQG